MQRQVFNSYHVHSLFFFFFLLLVLAFWLVLLRFLIILCVNKFACCWCFMQPMRKLSLLLLLFWHCCLSVIANAFSFRRVPHRHAHDCAHINHFFFSFFSFFSVFLWFLILWYVVLILYAYALHASIYLETDACHTPNYAEHVLYIVSYLYEKESQYNRFT